jgi:DNA (cytosine-5)-methyltransferase 1
MRYLSVCSGIEAASVAWHHLGWEPVGFSEIEPFPAAVLKHRFPHVPNYGDMTKFEEWDIEPGTVDLLVGGTPCQSFSVAGLRKGLEDPRGNLMLTYLAIAARLQPRWIVWENVPGVLSSNRGRDFATFLSALGQLGYGWAYRVLDAQYVRVGRWPRAVPQRRRRVFVIGRLIERGAGDWTAAAEVLAVREGLQRHLEAGGKARQVAASDAEGGARGGCQDTVGALCADTHPGAYSGQDAYTGRLIPAVLQPTAYRWQNDALGLQQDDAVAALRASAGSSGFHEMNHPVIAQPVPFTKAKRAQTVTDDETWVQGQVNPTLSLFDQGDTRATTVAVSVDLQNVNLGGDVAGTLDTTRPSRGGGQAVAFPINGMCLNKELRDKQMTGTGNASDPMYTVRADGTQHAVAFDWQSGGDSRGLDPKETAQLQRCQTPAVAHCLRADGFDASEDGTGRGTPLVPQTMTVRRLSARECERLQAFPDDWTLIPWRGKPAEQCPDGPRYRALGNSMACNCMAWIGEKIAKWEADHA